jgi:hypothetical protein
MRAACRKRVRLEAIAVRFAVGKCPGAEAGIPAQETERL